MSYALKLYKVRNPATDEYIQAVLEDYATGVNPTIFQGRTDLDETVTAFVKADGSAFVAIDHNPDQYTQFSQGMSAIRAKLATETDLLTPKGNKGKRWWDRYFELSADVPDHGGVDEFSFEAKSFNPRDSSIIIPGAHASF